MPVFNQLKFTEACLNSLYRNTDVARFYLTVIDNASTDGTTDFLKRYKVHAPNMELVISDENLGWCKGLNIGFRHFHKDSDFVLWANNDILFEADWLDRMIKHFHGGVGAVGPTSNYVMGRQQAVFNHGQYEEVAPFLIGFCIIFRKEVITLIGDVDERFGIGGSDEMDYIIRMKKELGLGCIIARDVYIHHFGSKTLMPHVGNTADGYNNFTLEKDKQLEEKWGREVLDLYLGYPTNDLIMLVPRRTDVKGKFWIDTLLMLKPPNFQVVDYENPSDICDGRNTLVEFAKKGGYKRVLFCDSDMRIPSNAIFKLSDIKAPIAAGYFFTRNPPHYACAFRLNQDDEFESFYSPNSGVQEVDAVGMAFTLIDMSIFDRLASPWFDRGKYGEDMTFCKRVRKELNLKIMVDTDLVVRHIGEGKEIGMEDCKK